MRLLLKFFVSVVPFLLTFIFTWLVMDGYLNFGGGEKDIFLAVPLLLWSLLFMCCYFVLWWRGSRIVRSVIFAGAFATGGLMAAWFVLFAVAWYRYG